MLQILRNKAQSLVIQIIVVIIALVFVFWGVGANLMDNREAALVINDEEISFQDFQVAYDRAYTNMRDQFGGNVPQGLLESLGIKEQVINQLIQESLLRQGAEKMGLIASREEIQETIENMVQFQEDGEFDLDKYKALLVANRYSPNKFEETIKLDLLVQKANLDIGGFAATATDFEIEDLHRMEKSTVAVKYVVISPKDYSDTIIPTDENLTEWYATVSDNYKTDPQVKLKYLDFSYATVGQKITVDEESIAKYYRDHSAEFTTPEQRKARHILFKADDNSSVEEHEKQKEKAQTIYDLAKDGSDFSDLASKYSEGPTKTRGGDLGLFTRGKMVKPFDDAVFSLKKNEISDIVKTSFGYHIIKLEEIVPAKTTPLEEVKDSIIEKLQVEEGKKLAFQVASEAYESIIAGGSLKSYLDANPEVVVRDTEFFSKNKPSGTVPGDAKFLNAAFELKQGELSSLVETANGYTILSAEAVKEPMVPVLADVREQVIADYTRNKTEEMAKQTATTLLQKAQEEKSLTKAAEMGGMDVADTGYLAKNSQDNDSSFPAPLVAGTFKLSGKEPFPEEPGKHEDTFYVYEFIGQKAPETQLTDEEKENYKNALINAKRQQIISAWLKSQRQQAKIFTHKSL